VRDQVEASLKRLGQEKLYGLLLHRAEDLLGLHGAQLIEGLADLKNDGVVKKVGVSIYCPDMLNEILQRAPIDLVQAPLNVIDRRMETTGWLDRLKDNGIEIHARSIFLQGLLLMERRRIPHIFSRWSNLWDRWHERLKYLGSSPLAACLAYPLSLKQVDQVIVGVDSVKQLQDILTAVSEVDYTLDTSFMKSSDTRLINPSNWNHL